MGKVGQIKGSCQDSCFAITIKNMCDSCYEIELHHRKFLKDNAIITDGSTCTLLHPNNNWKPFNPNSNYWEDRRILRSCLSTTRKRKTMEQEETTNITTQTVARSNNVVASTIDSGLQPKKKKKKTSIAIAQKDIKYIPKGQKHELFESVWSQSNKSKSARASIAKVIAQDSSIGVVANPESSERAMQRHKKFWRK